jgi:serine-type D-Ala-D-Ala carboxypeptidase (penicillin-binding protein 5/6)
MGHVAARATLALATVAALAALAVPPAGAAQPSVPNRLTVGGADLASRGIVVHYPSSRSPRLPAVPAAAYVIADASTGQVLAAKNAHGEFPPASTLKVLTAITLIPLLNPNAMVTASKDAADTEPNDAGLIAGHSYQVAQLFRALLLISANDAAVALTEATGSLQHGMALINAEAHRLQAYDVQAKDPNGLPYAGQVVSAYDEALIARQALRIPAFMTYDSTLSARFQVKPRHWETLLNQNYLLTHYRGGIGGKIGWTMRAQATYIGLARRNGKTLIVTILHCTPLQEITSAERLLNWGFDMDGKVKPVGVLVPPLPATSTRASSAQPAAKTKDQHGARPSASPSATDRSAAPLGAAAGPPAGDRPIGGIAIACGLLAAAGVVAGRRSWARRRTARSGRHRNERAE